MMSIHRRVGLLLCGILLWSKLAHATETSLFQGIIPAETGASNAVEILVGLVSPTESRPRADGIRVAFASGPARPPSSQRPFLDFAIERSRATDVWRPPVVLGIVYQWSDGTPPEVLQGIHRLARRLPQRTVVLPTPFGQGHYPIVNPTTAGKVAGGGLDDQAVIPGDAIAFLDSAQANLKDLAADQNPVRVLVIVSDGRDYERGEDAASFAHLGSEIRAAQIVTEVIGIPESGDRGQAVTNLRALANAANSRLLIAREPAEIPNLIESAGTIFFDSVVVSAPIPWSKRAFGGPVSVTVEATVGGQVLRAEAGSLVVESNGTGVLVVALLSLILLALIAAAVVWRQRKPGGVDAVESFLDDLQEMVRRKVAPDRAIADLSRRHPAQAAELASMDIDSLDAARFGFLRSRAGQQRVRQIAEALGEESRPLSVNQTGGVDSVLAETIRAQGTAMDCVAQIRAKLSERAWAPFARMSFSQLASFLKNASSKHALLASAKARSFALEVQEALRRDEVDTAIRVAWLVRSAGPGVRGETIPVPMPRATLGSASGCEVELANIGAAPRHLEIEESAGAFVLRSLDGQLKVEGTVVSGERPIVDGETLEIGKAQFVFKMAVDD